MLEHIATMQNHIHPTSHYPIYNFTDVPSTQLFFLSAFPQLNYFFISIPSTQL